jgi:hypothetical protein
VPAAPGRGCFDESRIGKVGAFAVNGGNLTELGTSPFALPAGAFVALHFTGLPPRWCLHHSSERTVVHPSHMVAGLLAGGLGVVFAAGMAFG